MVLDIAFMGGEGEGGAITPDDRRIYVPLTLPGERVEAVCAGDRGTLLSVLQRSAERVEPPCPHFGTCGGCALQHWAPDAGVRWKVERLRQTLARERLETEFLPAFAARPGERRRLALHARRGPRRDEALLGFKARRSWDVVSIQSCTVADPALTAALPVLRRLGAVFLEQPKSAPTLHVTLTATGLDVDVTGVEAKNGGLSADARRRAADIAAEGDMARVTLAGDMLYQARMPVVRFGGGAVQLPPGSFLQASAEAERVMAGDACDAARGARRIADLFCGAGAFSLPLAGVAPVLAADSSDAAIAALRGSLAGAPGLKTITPVARDLFRRPFSDKELKGVDMILFDPPRAGAAEQAAAIAGSGAAVVVGVSCNPATFVRDAALLVAGGFRLKSVRPVDQFLWSPHIELVGVFER
jgi:23S rRNA (uracil1939-C5)-methyltransferase